MIGARKFRTRRARTRERVRLAFRVALATVGLVGVLFLVGWGLRWEKLRINDVLVTGDGVLSEADVTASILSALEGHHALILPNDTVLFSGMGAVRNTLYEKFPRIEEVSLRRAGMRTLSATIRERTPQALWCGDVVPDVAYGTTERNKVLSEEAWGTCYLMDKESFIYAEAPVFTGMVFMRYYGSLTDADPIGQTFLESHEFTMWQNFLADLRRNGLEARALLLVDERDCELYLHNGLRLLIPRTENMETLTGRLFATVNDQSLDTTRPIEYVDLRFGSKAFIRYVEKETPGGEE